MNDLAWAVRPAMAGAAAMRLLIVTDAWHPQVNGVVRTVDTVTEHLMRSGDTVEVIGPDRFRTLPLPSYPEIRIVPWPRRRLQRLVDAFAPDAIHIATEGPLGWAMRSICLKRGWPFTTSFHTRFPEYLQARTGLPPGLAWAMLRRFHAAGSGVFAATASLRAELHQRGFTNLRAWTRGVALEQFRPGGAETGVTDPGVTETGVTDPWADLPRPVSLYVGRVAVEKNIEAFLQLDLPGSKVVVGDGPQRAALQRRFPEVHFAGWRQGRELAEAYAGADVFVFPSVTDTFGLVLLEAMACGTPVAAFPVTGPLDVVAPGTGALSQDLRSAVLAALECDRAACRRHAEGFSWQACAETFRQHLVMLPKG